MASKRGRVRVGTSGWIYRHWREAFYPKGLPVRAWFAYYAKRFDTVEVNNTFYRLPRPEVFDDWRRQAPRGFVYAAKASRYLTHQKKLREPAGPLERFLGRAYHLGTHLGPVLYQLPPHWHCDPERLRHFLGLLPKGVKHALEFRDPSWYTDAVRDLLSAFRVGFCIHDLRGAPCPLWVTGRLVYVRFHGPTTTAYAGRYRPPQLRAWADRIADFRDSGRDVYAYFNNDQAGHAVANALELQGLLGVGPAAVTAAGRQGRAVH